MIVNTYERTFLIMNKNDFQLLIADAVNDSELKSTDIPSIDLYVDQIINLHAEKLREGAERYHDKQLTKTMINNYAKDRVISPVKGKKYTKEQIIQILMIYTLKGTLSIGEIKRVLDGAYSIDGFGSDEITALYDRYCAVKEENRAFCAKVVDEMTEGRALDIENDEDFLVALGSIVSLSAYLKNIAQAMIDAKYPAPEPEEDEEKDKDKEKKKEEKKEEKKEKKENKEKEKELKENNKKKKKAEENAEA